MTECFWDRKKIAYLIWKGIDHIEQPGLHDRAMAYSSSISALNISNLQWVSSVELKPQFSNVWPQRTKGTTNLLLLTDVILRTTGSSCIEYIWHYLTQNCIEKIYFVYIYKNQFSSIPYVNVYQYYCWPHTTHDVSLVITIWKLWYEFIVLCSRLCVVRAAGTHCLNKYWITSNSNRWASALRVGRKRTMWQWRRQLGSIVEFWSKLIRHLER